MEFENITTEEKVDIFNATNDIFRGLISEIRELSKKKPDATLSEGKVKLINRVLQDLSTLLNEEPEAKFLDLLSDETLPQTSDAVLVMVQYETALSGFKTRYYKRISDLAGQYWITKEFVKDYNDGYDDE